MNTEVTTITNEQREKFFARLSVTGNVSGSAIEAGISRAYVYKLRKTDPAFAKRWEESVDELPERVRDAVVDEAVTGTPVLNGEGVVVGHRRNAALLARLAEKVGVLDAAKPTVAIQNNVNAPSAAAPTLQAEEQRLHEIAMRELRTITVEPTDPDEDIL